MTYANPEDANHLQARNWSALATGYVYSQIDGRSAYLHREILPVSGGLEVDHINHNGHDNRRQNLRAASRAQNGAARRRYTDPKSGFKGVRRHRSKWVARVSVNGQEIHLGMFESAGDAARAYDAAAVKAFGDFASTNFPRTSLETKSAG